MLAVRVRDLVLDHSALTPCGHKPEEEKDAIRDLAYTLLGLEVVWHVSAEYLKTLRSRVIPHWRSIQGASERLPRLIASLTRSLDALTLWAKRARGGWCKPRSLAPDASLMIHIAGRKASKRVGDDPIYSRLTSTYQLSREDAEVLALAMYALKRTRGGWVLLVSTDRELLEAARRVEGVLAGTPSKALRILGPTGDAVLG